MVAGDPSEVISREDTAMKSERLASFFLVGISAVIAAGICALVLDGPMPQGAFRFFTAGALFVVLLCLVGTALVQASKAAP